jgi:ACS family glucarate transporter-like MFS transporter
MAQLPTAAQRPTNVRYVVLLFLGVLAFITYFDRVCISSAQKVIQHDLNLTDGELSLIFSGFWLTYALCEIPSGWISDRFGSRQALSRIVLAWSIFTALSGAAMGFVSMLTYRLLFGAGEAGAFPNLARVQSRWFPKSSQGRIGGALWCISRWGGALSFTLFPRLLKALDAKAFRQKFEGLPFIGGLATIPSWRLGFWICGFVGLVWVMLFYPWFRDNPSKKRTVNQAELDLIQAGSEGQDLHGRMKMSGNQWAAMFRSPNLWGIALAYMCGSFGWSFFVSWMPKYMSDVQHPGANIAGWMNSGPLLFGGVACVLGGWLSDIVVRRTGNARWGRAIFPIIGFGIAAIAMAGIAFAKTPAQAFVLMCIGSIGNDIGQGAEWAAVIAIGGRYAGTAFGFINMVANVGGNTLQPPIGQAIFNHAGWHTLFWVYGAVYLTGSLIWTRVNPTRQFYADASDRT